MRIGIGHGLRRTLGVNHGIDSSYVYSFVVNAWHLGAIRQGARAGSSRASSPAYRPLAHAIAWPVSSLAVNLISSSRHNREKILNPWEYRGVPAVVCLCHTDDPSRGGTNVLHFLWFQEPRRSALLHEVRSCHCHSRQKSRCAGSGRHARHRPSATQGDCRCPARKRSPAVNAASTRIPLIRSRPPGCCNSRSGRKPGPGVHPGRHRVPLHPESHPGLHLDEHIR